MRFGRQKRLTPAQVHTLQQERARGDLIRELMARYGLKKASIYRYLAQARLVAAEAADERGEFHADTERRPVHSRRVVHRP